MLSRVEIGASGPHLFTSCKMLDIIIMFVKQLFHPHISVRKLYAALTALNLHEHFGCRFGSRCLENSLQAIWMAPVLSNFQIVSQILQLHWQHGSDWQPSFIPTKISTFFQAVWKRFLSKMSLHFRLLAHRCQVPANEMPSHSVTLPPPSLLLNVWGVEVLRLKHITFNLNSFLKVL